MAEDGNGCHQSPDEWRRRESNPTLNSCNALQQNDLRLDDFGQSAHVSQSSRSSGHELAHPDADLCRIVSVWTELPEHIQQAILTLLDAAQQTQQPGPDT